MDVAVLGEYGMKIRTFRFYSTTLDISFQKLSRGYYQWCDDDTYDFITYII